MKGRCICGAADGERAAGGLTPPRRNAKQIKKGGPRRGLLCGSSRKTGTMERHIINCIRQIQLLARAGDRISLSTHPRVRTPSRMPTGAGSLPATISASRTFARSDTSSTALRTRLERRGLDVAAAS